MKIFISYSSSDRLHAFELFRILESDKHDVWLDYFDIMPSEKLEHELTSNISQADVVCIIFTPNSMSSKWVEYEIKVATQNNEKNPRILGVIVHSCKIPDYVSDIIHLDARNGLQDQTFIARLKRAIEKTDIKDQELLLDLARREELAKQSVIDRANTNLPFRVDEIEAIADKKIDSIQISIDPDSISSQEKIVYELKLKGDPLFNASMHFYFTTYEEGHTWPEEFGFSEPSFMDFFRAVKPKIDGKLKWYDEVFDLVGSIDGTDFKDSKASFSFTFTGEEFNKGKSEFFAKGKLEFPTIKEFLKDNSAFEMIAHYPGSNKTKRLDGFNAELDLHFSAYIREEKKWLTLFKSRHTREEELAYSCDFMKNNPNMIYQELLMNEFSKQETATYDRKLKIASALHEEKELEPQDSSLGGFYASSQGDLYFSRGDYNEASRWYMKACNLLQPAVFEKFPTYKESMILFHANKRLADCLNLNTQRDLKERCLSNLIAIATHLIEKFPNEVDYERLLAIGLLHEAEMKYHLGKIQEASGSVINGIEIYQLIYEQISTAENYSQLCQMKTAALEFYADSPMASLIPVEEWKKDIAPWHGDVAEVLDNNESIQKEGPVWLKKASDENWPVQLFHSPLLRYSIAVPKRWNSDPILSNTQMEIKHLFKGRTPSEFLSVSFMEKATAGKMTSWVDTSVQISGLPVLEISTDTNPNLLNWVYEGTFDVVAKKYDADEAHCYSGIIELNDNNRHRARVYILLLRRNQFAWKFVLSFETALFPGMPESLVYSNDHIRAGSTFGELTLD